MKTALLILFSFLSTFVGAQTIEQRKANFNTNKHNVVNDGYDPISYFNGKPLKGKETLSLSYKGVIYWFASEENRVKFKTDPIKFEPQFGGWCAYALGLKSQKVKVNPETYKIIDGKLYLFYNFGSTNTLTSWNKEEKLLLPKANQNWKKLIK